ncbi:MAG: hypothetical protein Q4G22_06880 [Paracoccus sp. (in: a-proteobacteria)]|uniref:hypothetical protein n=1 Tax=Paracoccus sp. TaxID=267 RepID=UPI0026DEAB8A|nr:hypothetical protein [Paracoccus sp. (in: a-proteobacteria)]MDO5631545.1 hypothetical protein [Paracoccus sp. (in: a-proteobacteria)]
MTAASRCAASACCAFAMLIRWLAKAGRNLSRTGRRIVDRMPILRSVYAGERRSRKPFSPILGTF